MPDRRKLERKYLMFYTRIFDRATGILLGHLCDLTAEGLMLICEQPLPEGKAFRLRIDLPEGFGFDRTHLDLEGCCVWTAPDIDPNFFNSGFRLENVPPDVLAVIERLLKDFGLRE